MEAVETNNLASVGESNYTVDTSSSRSADGLDAFTRPIMGTLHQMLQNQDWKPIQDAIRKDASVAMRIDDSLEEDKWFDDARKSALGGVNISSTKNNNTDEVSFGPKGGDDFATQDREEDNHPMNLRYWVGNNNNYLGVCWHSRANMHMQQKRTLLHSLCRMNLPSNEALVVQLTHNDHEGLRDLVGAVKTARMLINASHNITLDDDDDDDEWSDKNAKEEASTMSECSSHCNDCTCYLYRHYCPPVPRITPQTDNSIHSEDDSEMIQHTSVLTMTDAMGETPLHALTGAGSSHVDLIKVFANACRPNTASDNISERRPTVYDLLVAKNFHGCTPVHFLSDSESEDTLRFLLEKCQVYLASDVGVHPTMICDNEGDLPLHYAACNGASPSLLHTLTTCLGDARSALIRNNRGRLAIDDLIEWYTDELNERNNQEISEGEGSSEQSESEEESDGIESSSASSHAPLIKRDPQVSLDNKSKSHQEGDMEYHVSSNFGFLSLEPDWESELWDRMWLLIQAASATAIRNVVHTDVLATEEFQMKNDMVPPLHAAVIATKCANFPALALAAIMLKSCDSEDGNRVRERSTSLLEEDFLGYLPLHWACKNLNDNVNETNRQHPLYPSTAQCKQILRWNTEDLPCTIIEYLLHSQPTAARVPTRQGRLPLHLLVEDNSSASVQTTWDDIQLLLRAYPEALWTPDGLSGLYPFQLAAAATQIEDQSGLHSLEISYRLVQENPSLLCQILEK